MNLIEALLWCEKVNRLYKGKKSKKSLKKSINPFRKPLTPEQRKKVAIAQNNYRKTPLNSISLRKRTGNDIREDDFVTEEVGIKILNSKPQILSRFNNFSIRFNIILNHLKTKNEDERRERKEDIKFLMNTLLYPQEVWEQPYSKRLVFIKQFKTIKDGEWITLTMTAIVSSSDNELITYYHTIDNVQEAYKDRWGTCLYDYTKS